MFIVNRLRASQRGATAVEYGLIAGLIAIGIIGALMNTKSSLNKDLSCVSSGLAGLSNPCSTPLYDPATPIGQAQALLPPGVILIGPAHAANGSAISWATSNSCCGNPYQNIAMVVNGQWSWFTGQYYNGNGAVNLITSSTAALDTPQGARAYFLWTAAGPIMVNTTGG